MFAFTTWLAVGGEGEWRTAFGSGDSDGLPVSVGLPCFLIPLKHGVLDFMRISKLSRIGVLEHLRAQTGILYE